VFVLPALRLPAFLNLVEVFFPDDGPESPERKRAKRAIYVTTKTAVTSRGTPRSFARQKKNRLVQDDNLFVDGNFEASAEEELLLVDDALVGADDGAGVPLVEVQVGVGGR
jgi:hypothetical protein